MESTLLVSKVLQVHSENVAVGSTHIDYKQQDSSLAQFTLVVFELPTVGCFENQGSGHTNSERSMNKCS